MARIRSIKPEFWTSEQIMECSPIARLLFVGLWNFCDDGGNHPANGRRLKAEVFPGDDFTVEDILKFMDELISQNLVVRYASDGQVFWHVTGWHHQRIEKKNFKYPEFQEKLIVHTYTPEHSGNSTTSRRLVGDHSTTAPRLVVDRSTPDIDVDIDIDIEKENISLLHNSVDSLKNKGESTNDFQKKSSDTPEHSGNSTTSRRLVGSHSSSSSEVVVESVDTKSSTNQRAFQEQSPPVVNTKPSRAVEIATLLRKNRIRPMTASHPLAIELAENPRVTNQILMDALQVASDYKPSGNISPNYLRPIIEGLLNPPTQHSAGVGGRMWHDTASGIVEKGKELGIVYAEGKEKFPDFKLRVFKAVAGDGVTLMPDPYEQFPDYARRIFELTGVQV